MKRKELILAIMCAIALIVGLITEDQGLIFAAIIILVIAWLPSTVRSGKPVQTFTLEEVKALLKKQRENCYTNYIASNWTTDKYSDDTENAIKNAWEPSLTKQQ